MALPNYVVQRDVTGDSDLENVVILKESGNFEWVLLWDYLDSISKNQFDAISSEPDLITALKENDFRNQTLYSYLNYAIKKIEFEANKSLKRNLSEADLLNDVFVPSTKSLRMGKYSNNEELSVFESTNVLSYLSFYGPSRLRDTIHVTNTATVTSNEGKIRLQTGSTSNSEAKVDTVERGRYIPGKAAESGVAIFLSSTLTGDQFVEIGVGDDDNGAFFRITANNVYVEVVRNGIKVHSTERLSWNINPADGKTVPNIGRKFNYDPTQQGYIYNIRYSWYGVGKIIFSVQSPVNQDQETLTTFPLHEYNPIDNNGNTFVDANLPIRVKTNNGSTASNVIVDIGGRKFDVQGQFAPEIRHTNELATITNLSDRRSVLAFRKKDNFPDNGRINSVPMYFTGWEADIDVNGIIRVYTVERGTLSNNWTSPDGINTSSETGVEVNTTLNDITAAISKEILRGPYLISGGNKKTQSLSKEKGLRTPIPNSDEVVIEFEPSVSATGRLIGEIVEEW